MCDCLGSLGEYTCNWGIKKIKIPEESSQIFNEIFLAMTGLKALSEPACFSFCPLQVPEIGLIGWGPSVGPTIPQLFHQFINKDGLKSACKSWIKSCWQPSLASDVPRMSPGGFYLSGLSYGIQSAWQGGHDTSFGSPQLPPSLNILFPIPLPHSCSKIKSPRIVM